VKVLRSLFPLLSASGSFNGKCVLPAAAWPMYQPELRGESNACRMEVRGR